VANALAEIEGNALDWRLCESLDKRVWSKNENGTAYVFTVDRSGASECHKAVNGGASRRVTDGCKKSITPKEIEKLLGSH
jgi:hypothetical protein